MVTFQIWFRKKILLRFYLLLFIAIIFLVTLWIRLEEKKLQAFNDKLDYITSIVDQSFQRKDRTLLENIAYYSLKDAQSKSFNLCLGNDLIYSLSNDFFDCAKTKQKYSIFEKTYKKNLKSNPLAILYVSTDQSPIAEEAIVILFFVSLYLSSSFFQLKLINNKINSDILLPLSDTSNKIKTPIIEVYETLRQRQKIKEDEISRKIFDSQTKQARQLSHDIRSPLAALKVVKDMGAAGMEPDVAKLLTMSIDRITDIANTILPKNTVHGENKENAQSSFLWMLVDQIISEKRVEYKSSSDISIDFKTESSPFELNVLCNPTEFMRSISNMINNSIEAKDPLKKLNISVSLSRSHDYVLVTIQDNGKGMPPEVLTKAFDEGFTHGKTQGTGLGLYQVKKAIESWGGSIHIESQTNVGTTIIIKLKQSTQPQWLVNSIDVSNCKNIVVLDDEEYVFSILQDRFESYVKLQYFKRIDDFEKNIPTFSDTLFFIDHDLKQDMNGIDLIQKHNLQGRSILLTGNYDDKQVQTKASAIGIKILPKPLINNLPIIA